MMLWEVLDIRVMNQTLCSPGCCVFLCPACLMLSRHATRRAAPRPTWSRPLTFVSLEDPLGRGGGGRGGRRGGRSSTSAAPNGSPDGGPNGGLRDKGSPVEVLASGSKGNKDFLVNPSTSPPKELGEKPPTIRGVAMLPDSKKESFLEESKHLPALPGHDDNGESLCSLCTPCFFA